MALEEAKKRSSVELDIDEAQYKEGVAQEEMTVR